MICGVGTDLLDIKRMQRTIGEGGDSAFLRLTFTRKEHQLAHSRSAPLLFYATRFSGKEAVFKALGTNGDELTSMLDIEILSTDDGAPYVALHGDAQRIAQEKGIDRIHISLSFECEYASAFAITEKLDTKN